MFIITFYHCVPLVSSKIAKFTRIDLNSGGVWERAPELMSNNSTSNCENHTPQYNQILQLPKKKEKQKKDSEAKCFEAMIYVLEVAGIEPATS